MEPEVLPAGEARRDERPEPLMARSERGKAWRGRQLAPPDGHRRADAIAVVPEPANSQEHDYPERGQQHEGEAHLPDVPLEQWEIAPEGIAEPTEDAGPGDAPERVVECEPAVRHARHTRERRGPAPKQRDEPADEDRLGPVALEEGVYARELRLVQSDLLPVPADERDAALPTQPVSRVVADHRS